MRLFGWKTLLVPWYALQLVTGAKSFGDNPLLGSRRLNRLGLHSARVRIAAAMARRRRRGLARSIHADDRLAFERDGYIELRNFLPAAVFEQLRAQVLGYDGCAREMVQGNAVTRRIAIDPEILSAIPATRTLIEDPHWRGLLRYVASHNAEPLIYIQSILSGSDGENDPQTVLHSDTFHSSAKAWLFLNDVGEDEGPFCFVPGSHRATEARLAWEKAQSLRARDGPDRLSARGSLRIDPEDRAALGLPEPKSFAVPANTLIVADTYGFHARTRSARPTTRVEIWAYSRSNPFLPWSGFDIAGLPGIAERRIGWMWRVRDLLSGIIGQPWRDVGRKRPGDPVHEIGNVDNNALSRPAKCASRTACANSANPA